jgi:Winged helix DNA-binding domain
MLEEEGPLTRSEIAERLARRGIPIEGQAAYHLVALAALEGHACMGPDRGGEPTLVLLRDWLGPRSTLERDAALAELARRYLCAYVPAAPEDMAAWSGFGLTEVRKGWRLIAQELSEVEVAGGQKAWTLRSQNVRLGPAGFVGLLPGSTTTYSATGAEISP